MVLCNIIDFKIVREKELSKTEEVAILHQKGVSIDKLTMDLLYDREWCDEQGIRYYDLKSPNDNLSAFEIAQNFVINSIFNLTYTKNGNSQA